MPLLSCWLLVMDAHIFHQQFNLLERATNLLQRFLHFYSSCTVSGSMTLLNHVLILVYLPFFFMFYYCFFSVKLICLFDIHYQPSQLTDFEKLLKNEVAKQKAKSSSISQNQSLIRQFREAVWVWPFL